MANGDGNGRAKWVAVALTFFTLIFGFIWWASSMNQRMDMFIKIALDNQRMTSINYTQNQIQDLKIEHIGSSLSEHRTVTEKKDHAK